MIIDIFRIEIKDVPAYLKEHTDDTGDDVDELVKNVVAYLKQYKVSPRHYTIFIEPGESSLVIQIDEQCGRIDRRVSRSKFEFINGTCFMINLDDLPNRKE